MKHFILFVLVQILPFCAKAQSTSEHTVVKGETLQAIASKYGITIPELKSLNTGLDDYVFAGMVLKIPAKADVTSMVKESSVIDLKDIIYLKDGSELVAKVLSIDADNVQFEQYDTDDPFSISKNEIASIKYEDGSVLNFATQNKKKVASTKRTSTSKKVTR